MPLPASVADRVNVTAGVVVDVAPPFISIEPVGGVVSGTVSVIAAEYAIDQLPATSLNFAYTVLAPFPEDKVYDLAVE